MPTTHAPTIHAERFHAMGTDAEIQVIGGDHSLVARGRAQLAALEARWSRFRPDSDISALNRQSGHRVPVAPETILLLQRAVAAARSTEGRYDPTSGAALIAHGYDRTFAEVADRGVAVRPRAVIDGSWPLIEIDPVAGRAYLPPGTVFDPGGIGKGLAADLTVGLLRDHCDGVLVNIGGDLRVEGAAPDREGWVISIDDPTSDRELGRLTIEGGGVASSSCAKRRWRTGDGATAHHLIDPRTGRPADTGVLAVTVVAAEAWWAEIQATALLLAGPDALTGDDPSVEAALVLTDGTVRATPAFAAVLR